MAPLIEVIEEDCRRRCHLRDIMDDVIIGTQYTSDIINAISKYNKLKSVDQRHEVTFLLYRIVSFCQKESTQDNEIQFIAKPVIELLQQPTAYIQWKSKCLVLMIVTKLLDIPEIRQQVLQVLKPLFYIYFLSDPNENLHICIFQLIEKAISVHEDCWIDWCDCLLGMGEHSPWMDWACKHLPKGIESSRVQSRMLLCVNTPEASLHRDDLVHYSLYIIEGILSRTSPQLIADVLFPSIESMLVLFPREIDVEQLVRRTLQRDSVAAHLCCLFYLLGCSALVDFPDKTALVQDGASSTVESFSCLFLNYVYGLINSKSRSSHDLLLQNSLLQLLRITYMFLQNKASPTLQIEYWNAVKLLCMVRKGNWLSGRLWSHVLFVQQASIDPFVWEEMDSRELIRRLGGEANKIAYQLMLFLDTLRESREPCELDCYLKGELAVFASIRFILTVIKYQSLSEEAGRSGLFCRWLLKLLLRVNYADSLAKKEFGEVLQVMKRVLQDAPALSLLPYYSQIITGMKNNLQFSHDPESVRECYAIVEVALRDMIRDQADQELSVLAVETMHQLISSLPVLTLYCYDTHLNGICRLFSVLDAGYCFAEFQRILQFAEGGFMDAVAVRNVEALLQLLIVVCDRCPDRVRHLIRDCCLIGFDALFYAGRMRVAGDTGSVDSLVTTYWLQLVEITGETAMKYLDVFYQRVESQAIEHVLDVRKSVQAALQKHVEEDHCDFCSQFC